jgi:hypothetical protein
MTERESRIFWGIDDDAMVVKEVTGWSCAETAPGYWWVPELGVSTTINGGRIHETRGAAIKKALHYWTTEMYAIQEAITDLTRDFNAITDESN